MFSDLPRRCSPARAVVTGLVAAGVLALLLLPGAAPAARASLAANAASASAPAAKTTYPVTNVPYNASTDGFQLSYGEKLPNGYSTSKAYPLVVYLHGEGTNSTWMKGGAGDGLGNYQTDPSANGQTLRSLFQNASTYGAIVMAPSPRTVTGFYTNTPCGGPQEQDTLDAITVEEARRNISEVFLLGFSMGSMGALAIAGHHPGMFAGLALTGTVTDAFQRYAYKPNPSSGLTYMTCSVRPSATNTTVTQILSYLSVLRFHPQNFSGARLWTADGGQDHGATNNGSLWGFYQVNNTFLNSTCYTVPAFGEPANCTTPIRGLHTSHPSLYPYRLVWEPLASHLFSQLSASDMFRYLLGMETGGCVASTFPPTTFTPCP